MRSHKTQGSIIGPGSQVFSLSFLRLTFKTALPTKTSLKGPKGTYVNANDIQTYKLKDSFSANVGPAKAQGPQTQSLQPSNYLHPNSLSWYSHLSKQDTTQMPRQGFCTFKLYFPHVSFCLRGLKDVQVFR